MAKLWTWIVAVGRWLVGRALDENDVDNVDDADTGPDLVTLLRSLAGTLRDLAKFTKTTVDDQLARLIQIALSNDALLALIATIVGDRTVIASEGPSRDAAITGLATMHEPRLRPIVEAAGLDWASFLPLLMQLVRFVLGATGKRVWQMPWA